MVELAFRFFVPASCIPHDIVTTARKVRENQLFAAIDTGPQIDRLAGEEHLRPRRQADHVAPFIARSTRDSACSFTEASTLTRAPFGSTISIPPTPMSLPRMDPGDAGSGCCGGASIAVSRWPDPQTPPAG
jgi:hypothetical protein